MFRLFDFKLTLKGQSLSKFSRYLSAQTASATVPDTKFQDEWNNAKSYKEIPGESKLKMMRAFLPGGKYHNIQLIDLHRLVYKEFGKISKFPAMFGQPELVTTFNVEDAEKVFRFEGRYPYRRALETLTHYRKTIRPDVYAEHGGLLSEQDEVWWRMRSIVNPVLLKPVTVKLYVPQVDEIAKEFLEMITKKRDEKNEVPANFSDFLNLWSLESITFISLNRRLGLMSPNNNDEKAQQLIKYIRQFFVLGYEFEILPSIWRYYETKAFKNLLSVYDGMTNIIMHYVDKAMEDISKQPPKEDREESVLEKLVKVDPKIAVVMCADAMLAGVDTTASGFIGILYCLAKNPEKQEKLREELRQILPNNDEPLTPERMRNMPYLRAVIKEGIRLYSPTAGTLRKTASDIVLSGYQVPKGTEVLMGLMLLNRDENQFARPDEFIPERFLKSNTDASCPHARDAHPFAYLPFGFGTRMCPGRRLAELEIEVLITRLIQKYKVEFHYPEFKVKSVLANIPEGDLKFKLTEV